jgi:acyl-CoA reductase-like NAD-dependent aldehyde dehydrogenase
VNTIRNPATEETIAELPHAGPDEVDAAVAAARAAHRPESAPEPAPRGWQRRAEGVRLSA